jgi:hypothetical protein
MISFILFIAFVLFLLLILMPPISTQKDKEKIFQGIEIKMINEISSNMTIITANIGDIEQNCVNLDDFMGNGGIGNKIIVKDSSGKSVNSNINGDSLQIVRVSTGDKFFKIYYSEEFEELNAGAACSLTNYSIGLTKTSRYSFEKKFIELMNRDYATLKAEMKVPEGIGFGYGMVLSNGTTIETKENELYTKVYIKETPIEYVDLDGNIQEGYIKTKVW